jgi:hypothetical protein
MVTSEERSVFDRLEPNGRRFPAACRRVFNAIAQDSDEMLGVIGDFHQDGKHLSLPTAIEPLEEEKGL